MTDSLGGAGKLSDGLWPFIVALGQKRLQCHCSLPPLGAPSHASSCLVGRTSDKRLLLTWWPYRWLSAADCLNQTVFVSVRTQTHLSQCALKLPPLKYQISCDMRLLRLQKTHLVSIWMGKKKRMNIFFFLKKAFRLAVFTKLSEKSVQ